MYALLVMEDQSLVMVNKNATVWQREESLALVSKIEFMDLPSSHVFDTYMTNLEYEQGKQLNSFLTCKEPIITQFTNRLIAQGQQIMVGSELPNLTRV